MPDELDERLHAIDRRLARIESLLEALGERPPAPSGARATSPAEPVGPSMVPAPLPVKIENVSDGAAPPPLSKGGPPEPATVRAEVLPPPNAWTHPPPSPGPPDEVPFAQPAPVLPPPPAKKPLVYAPKRPPRDRNLEQAIGLKWAGWAGAIVLVIGAGLGYKFAYDQGWLGGIPDAARVGALSLIGFILIAAGELVLRRVDRLAAAGLYGAGVAILFLSAYAGHAWYGLFADRTAMGLMGVAALLGAMLSHRSGLVAIAVLATIGGAIAPAVVRGQPSLTPFLIYLLFLQAMALALCWKNATRRWWALRGVALAATAVWTFVIAANSHGMAGTDLTILLVGALMQAALFQAELIATTLRARLAEVAERAAGVVFSLLVTSALVVTILLATPHLGGPVQGSLLLAIAAACAVVGTWVRRYDRPAAKDDTSPSPRLDALGQGLRWQAMALVTLAVPVALDGPAVVVAWALLAVLLAAAARQARSRATVVTAYAVWLLSALAWVVWGQTAEGVAVWLSPGGVALGGRVVMAIVIAATGHAVAVVLGRPESVNATVHHVFHGLAAFVALIAAWSWIGALPGAVMVIAYALLLAGASLARFAAVLGVVAAVVWLVQTFEWTTFELLRPRVDRRYVPTPGGLGSYAFLIGLLQTGGVAMIAVLAPRLRAVDAESRRSLRGLCGALVPILLIVIGSVEIDRYAATSAGGPEWIVRQVGWSVWWTLVAAGCLVAGFAARSAGYRYAALALLGVTLLKVVVIDLSGAGTGWRILSVVGMGVVLLATSVLYGRFGRRENGERFA